jgi:cobalt-zinc-cadmium efflux system membrane fusion protein
MSDRLKSALSLFRSNVSNLCVFAVLGLILFLGHKYDWKLPRNATASTSPSASDAPTPKLPAARPTRVAERVAAEPERIQLASSETASKVNFKSREIESAPFPEYIIANGSVEYVKSKTAQLSTRAPGVVWQVIAKVGDYVKEGDTLAIVESVEIGKAKSDFLQAVIQYELKEKILNVSRNLESTIAKKEIVEMESRLREAKIQLVNAQQTLINLGLPIDIHDCHGLTDEQIVRKLHTLGLPPDWAAKFDVSRTTANLVPLKAPFAGYVIGTDLVKGEAILPNEAKIVIANTETMWVVLDVGIEDAYRLRLGQEVVFKPDGYGDGDIVSNISWISTEADPKTRRVQVRTEVKNPSGVLRANIFGSGKVKVREQANALAVANDALHWDLQTKTHMVFVELDDKTFEARPIRLGARGETKTEIIGDVRAGDRVAVDGSYMLKSELLRVRSMASAGK